jgi:alkylated DNA repair dioxygenase AlkB
MIDLFDIKYPGKFEKTILDGGEIWLMNNFLSPDKSNNFFKIFQNNINWKQESVNMYGNTYDVPRKTAWYGDKDANYSYSGINCSPNIWSAELLELKNSIELLSSDEFNSVLLNMYRDGNDKVGWHSDNEKELGENPSIASVSLGTTRRFDLKHKTKSDKLSIELRHGSLLIMKGALQHNWLHQIPSQKRIKTQRINLTYRNIKTT